MMYRLYADNKNHYLASKKMIGGKHKKKKRKDSESKQSCDDSEMKPIGKFIMTTYQLTGNPLQELETIRLPGPKIIKRIGDQPFKVNDKVVIGDTDYSILNLKPGYYDAYKVDDNLVIINTDLNLGTPDQSIKNWVWEHSKQGVGVDTGQFGFYDLATTKKIAKYVKNIYSEISSNNLPSVTFSNTQERLVTMDQIDREFNEICDSDFEKLKSITFPFGVISDTGVGDGGFECYVIGNDRAVLVGGNTSEKLYEQKKLK